MAIEMAVGNQKRAQVSVVTLAFPLTLSCPLVHFPRTDDPQAAYGAFGAASKLKRLPADEDVIEAITFLALERSSFYGRGGPPSRRGKICWRLRETGV